MKAVAILILAFVAMAASQVNVVDNNNPGGVKVVDNSDPNKVHVVEQPDPVHVVDNSGHGIDTAFYRPSAPSGGGNNGVEYPCVRVQSLHTCKVNAEYFVDDAAFGRPSANYPEQPSIDPAFVVDPGFYQPSYPPQGPSLDPTFVDPGFYRPSDPNAPTYYNPGIVDPGFYLPSDPNAPNIGPTFVDPGFYRPSAGGNNGPYQQQRPYPPKQYSFPGARDGK